MTNGSTERGRRWLWPAALVVGIALVYAPSLRNGFVYDDYGLIVRTGAPESWGEALALLTQPHGHKHPYYRPVAAITMAGQKALHGDNAAPFHLFNLVLVVALALLVYLLLRFPAFGVPPTVALMGAGLLALHPSTSSCVYPITGREALLCAVFATAAVTAFLRGGAGWAMVSWVCLSLALLSREQAVIVPGLFVCADLLGLSSDRPGRSARRWILRYAPVLTIVALYAMVRSAVLGDADAHRVVVFAEPTMPLRSFAYLLQTSLMPFAELVYEPRLEVWSTAGRQLWAVALAFAAGVLVYRMRAQVGRGVLFWLAWMTLSLLPTANLLRQEAPYAERHTLLSLVGIIGIAALLASLTWSRPLARRRVVAVGAVLLVSCSVVTVHRSHYFRDNDAFFAQWIRTDPGAPQAHLSLGDWYERTGRLDEAAREYREVAAMWPNHAVTLYSLGTVLLKQGEPVEAAAYLTRIVERDPEAALPRYKLAVALLRQGDLDAAAEHLGETIRIQPRYARAHLTLGVVRARGGRLEEAVRHYRRALKLDPQLGEARHNLRVALERMGTTAGASAPPEATPPTTPSGASGAVDRE